MSNRLIAEYGLDKLLECSLKELEKIKGIGPGKAMQILTIAELQKRINQSKHPLKKISCAKDVFDIMHDRLKDEKQENFYILMLNNQNRIIKEEAISKGILDSAIIHPREVFRPAIKNSSARIILVHNHPSGNPQPSEEDLDSSVLSIIHDFIDDFADCRVLTSAIQIQQNKEIFFFVTADQHFDPNGYNFIKTEPKLENYKFPNLKNFLYED